MPERRGDHARDAATRWREYELALELMSQEQAQMWTPLSILLGAEALIIGGAISRGRDLLEHPAVLWWAYMPVALLTVAAAVYALVNRYTGNAVLRIVAKLEEESDGELRLFEIANRVAEKPTHLLWRLRNWAMVAMAVGTAASWILGVPILLVYFA